MLKKVFVYVICKKLFQKSRVRISQKAKGVVMLNLWYFIFMGQEN